MSTSTTSEAVERFPLKRWHLLSCLLAGVLCVFVAVAGAVSFVLGEPLKLSQVIACIIVWPAVLSMGVAAFLLYVRRERYVVEICDTGIRNARGGGTSWLRWNEICRWKARCLREQLHLSDTHRDHVVRISYHTRDFDKALNRVAQYMVLWRSAPSSFVEFGHTRTQSRRRCGLNLFAIYAIMAFCSIWAGMDGLFYLSLPVGVVVSAMVTWRVVRDYKSATQRIAIQANRLHVVTGKRAYILTPHDVRVVAVRPREGSLDTRVVLESGVDVSVTPWRADAIEILLCVTDFLRKGRMGGA